MNGISNDLKKLVKYFSGTTIFSNTPLSAGFTKILDLCVKNDELY